MSMQLNNIDMDEKHDNLDCNVAFMYSSNDFSQTVNFCRLLC